MDGQECPPPGKVTGFMQTYDANALARFVHRHCRTSDAGEMKLTRRLEITSVEIDESGASSPVAGGCRVLGYRRGADYFAAGGVDHFEESAWGWDRLPRAVSHWQFHGVLGRRNWTDYLWVGCCV